MKKRIGGRIISIGSKLKKKKTLSLYARVKIIVLKWKVFRLVVRYTFFFEKMEENNLTLLAVLITNKYRVEGDTLLFVVNT